MSEDGDWDEDDYVPWADPQIQKDYEAALGAFLVSFNRIEDQVSRLIATALTRLKRADLHDTYTRVPLNQRLHNLQLILLAFPGCRAVPLREIETLAHSRNILAHGHFDQNPYQGNYEITGRGKSSDWPPEKISEQAAIADKLYDQLRSIEAFFAFFDPPNLSGIPGLLTEPPKT